MIRPYDIEIKLVIKGIAFDSTLQAHEAVSKELEKLAWEKEIIKIVVKSVGF